MIDHWVTKLEKVPKLAVKGRDYKPGVPITECSIGMKVSSILDKDNVEEVSNHDLRMKGFEYLIDFNSPGIPEVEKL
jgi:hypothetical protein